ncbi:alpha/beta hydrolase [Lysinibacillus piscis]|uniref:Serine aminopeptidase S33 domain-containing protein n=1 Tax=Lysinibacillus piscis TaxID=2518931 RepID=A0ABQ5NLU6_9BACI|nr:lysophospholipase [Lysinibacillus sp. KH24]GLC89225.1 hypothetical protein LYSBPC_23520 [Lysinibacillus sp. KH24]
MKKWLCLWLVVFILTACTQKEEESNMNKQFVGRWEGILTTPNGALPIEMDLQRDSGTFSVPAQGLANYPLKSIAYKGDEVNITINLKGSMVGIKGTLKDQQIEATFQQNGGTFQLVLKPYQEQSITYDTIKVPVKNGELTVAVQKASKELSPVAVIIAGSGPTDKDGNSAIGGKNNSLKMLAEQLATQGITTVRYDKRGIGDNQSLLMKEQDVTIDVYADDVVQILNTLAAEKAYSSIHVIGHSEGSLIGILAAQKTPVTSFISIAGAGRPIDAVLLEQLQGQLPPQLMEEATAALATLKKGAFVQNVSSELQSLFRPSIQPYMISWLKYDPASELAKVNSSVLLIQGTSDLQVVGTDAEALKKGKPDAKLVYMEGMNHVLKNAPMDRTSNLATYADPSLPLHKELVPTIQHFILGE